MVTAVYSYGRPKLVCPDNIIYCHLSSPEFILKEIGVSGDDYWFDATVLILMIVCVRIVTYYTLKKKLCGK
jgi:hypothetical protein